MISIKSGTFKFFIEFNSDGVLPKFRGSTIRGAIGYQLKKTVCHTRKKNCDECIVSQDCIYKTVFEGMPPDDREILRKYPTIPQPFILDVSPSDDRNIKSGDSYCFSMRLFGKAISHLPYIVYSLIEIGKKGLGKDRIPFTLKKVVQELQNGDNKELYTRQNSNMTKPETENLIYKNNTNENYDGKLEIEFITPAKYRHKGSLSSDTSFDILFKTIARRTRIMAYFYGDIHEDIFDNSILNISEKIKTINDDTHLSQFTRISGRQNRKIKMSGVVGKTVYEGNFTGLMPFLKAAEVLHVGKNTTFGFGKVNINFEGVSNVG